MGDANGYEEIQYWGNLSDMTKGRQLLSAFEQMGAHKAGTIEMQGHFPHPSVAAQTYRLGETTITAVVVQDGVTFGEASWPATVATVVGKPGELEALVELVKEQCGREPDYRGEVIDKHLQC